MPAPGTKGIIPGIINTVAGFLLYLAKSSPMIPTDMEASKVLVTVLILNIFKDKKYIPQLMLPTIPTLIMESFGVENRMLKPIVEMKANNSCLIISIITSP